VFAATRQPARCPSAVPVLRWAHDRHRDLRPLESAQGTAASARLNRGDGFVTRHALNHAWTAATALRPTAHLMRDVINCDLTLFFGHHCSTTNCRAARQCRNETIRKTPRSDGRTVLRIERLLIAGSFIQDFRTPTAPETLQDFCRSASRCGSAQSGRRDGCAAKRSGSCRHIHSSMARAAARLSTSSRPRTSLSS
jgi:hypothetical protein